MLINWKIQYFYNVNCSQIVPSKFIQPNQNENFSSYCCTSWPTACIIYIERQRTWVIKEMRVKATIRYHYSPTRMAKLKDTDTTKYGRHVKLEFSYIAGGNAKWYRHLRKPFGSFLWSFIHYPVILRGDGVLSWRHKNVCAHVLYKNVLSTCFHNS